MVRTLCAAALLTGLGLGVAEAATGFATGSVNLRMGPGAGYARIATIPAGAPVEVFRCTSWCQVAFAGRRGWVSSRYISTDYAAGPDYWDDEEWYPSPRVGVGIHLGDGYYDRWPYDRYDRWPYDRPRCWLPEGCW